MVVAGTVYPSFESPVPRRFGLEFSLFELNANCGNYWENDLNSKSVISLKTVIMNDKIKIVWIFIMSGLSNIASINGII